MKDRPTRVEFIVDEFEMRLANDSQAQFLARTFQLAHGRPRGPVGTLTWDGGVRMENWSSRVPPL